MPFFFRRTYFVAFVFFLLSSQFAVTAGVSSYNHVPTVISAKIIGGKDVSPSEWPWMAGLVYSGMSAWDGLFCGGALIAENWVLTAGHCVEYTVPEQVEVIINRTNLDATDGERIEVVRIVIHPEYDSRLFFNDIALLELAYPSRYQPIKTLDHFSVQDDGGVQAMALGWGATSPDGTNFPRFLQQVTLPIMALQQCGSESEGVIDTMLCAGDAGKGTDTCIGDSGGPLIVYDTESKQWRQAGITSFGFGDCGKYGIYTRVERFKTFISDTLCGVDKRPQTPHLSLNLADARITAFWSADSGSEGYRLNYAPYPDMAPIYSLDMNQANSFSVQLNQQDAYYVAISAYNGNCRSQFSNIEHFIVP